jgi:ketosteroid isomerase-like protein
MPDGAVIDRFFSSFFGGDLATCRACLKHDAVIWHNYDGIARDVDHVMASFAAYLEKTSELKITDVRRLPTTEGFVQQHLMIMGDKAGIRTAWPICIVVRIEDGLIARLDEYIARSESFDPAKLDDRMPNF